MIRIHIRPVLASIALCGLALLASCASCNVGSFTIEEQSSEVVVEGASGLLDDLPVVDVLPPMTIDFNVDEELAERDAKGAKEIFLESLTLNVTDSEQPEGDTDNFDFVEEVTIYVESRKSGTSLEKREIARLRDIPEGQQTVEFDIVEDVDLKPYVEEGVRLTTEGSGEVPPDDTSIQADVVIRVFVL